MSSLSNLSQRLLTAAVLVALLLLALFYAPPWLWAGFVLVFTAIGAHEWAALARFGARPSLAYAAATLLLALTAYFLNFTESPLAYLPALVFWVIGAPLWLARAWPGAQGIAALLLGWLLLLPTFLALVYLREQGALVLLAALSIAIVAPVALVLDWLPWGIQHWSIVIAEGLLLGLCSLVAMWRRGRSPSSSGRSLPKA